jgi:hypothetical protein
LNAAGWRSEFHDVGFFGHGVTTPKLKPKPVRVAILLR